VGFLEGIWRGKDCREALKNGRNSIKKESQRNGLKANSRVIRSSRAPFPLKKRQVFVFYIDLGLIIMMIAIVIMIMIIIMIFYTRRAAA